MAAVPAEVLDLRRELERRFPDAQPVRQGTTGAVATGIGPLDGTLPAGGLPRGRVTLWRPGGGATAVLRSSCEAVVAAGERAAWVDSAGVISGAYWIRDLGRFLDTADRGPSRSRVSTGSTGATGSSGSSPAPLLFRPADPVNAAACAEELLRSGGFALVVLTGVGAGGGRELGDGEGVRLGRAAREGGAAFVTVAGGAPVSHLKVRTAFDPGGFRWRRGPFGEPAALDSVLIRARLESMGLDRRIRFRLGVEVHDLRLSLEPRLVDRRGVRR
ncbi:MAG: hypothetical protein R3314_12215 [Longimicrobiales bacterium]|nr:hypothetical protein [Longimicrobiales bacterium]